MKSVSPNGNHLRSYLPFPLEMESCACAICSSKNARTLLKFDSFGFPTRTVECQGCGLVYVNPRPTRSFIQKFYSKYYYFYAEGFRRFSENYIKERMWREWAQGRLYRYARFIPEGSRVLDVGCGSGFFLNEVREKIPSATVAGIEPDLKMADFCRSELKIDIHNGSFETFPTSGSYDAITAFHVIEHIFDLPELFNFLRIHLRGGGVAIIETPNVAGGWNGIGMFHISHLYTFSPRTITNLFLSQGFDVLKAAPLENELDHSNLYLIARKVEKAEQKTILCVDKEESQQILTKCGDIRSLRQVRVIRNWAKMAYFGLKGLLA